MWILQVVSMIGMISFDADFVDQPRLVSSAVLLVIGYSLTNAMIYGIYSNLFKYKKLVLIFVALAHLKGEGGN